MFLNFVKNSGISLSVFHCSMFNHHKCAIAVNKLHFELILTFMCAAVFKL